MRNRNCDAVLGGEIVYCPCGCYECSLGDAMACCSPKAQCTLHIGDEIIEMMDSANHPIWDEVTSLLKLSVLSTQKNSEQLGQFNEGVEKLDDALQPC